MPKPLTTPSKPARRYHGVLVPMRAIRKFAREVAERFQPEKIILFGSYAYGTPDEGSDVDIPVIMNSKNRNQASQIRIAVPRGFAMDCWSVAPRRSSGELRRATGSCARS
jgi:hypothetical protein